MLPPPPPPPPFLAWSPLMSPLEYLIYFDLLKISIPTPPSSLFLVLTVSSPNYASSGLVLASACGLPLAPLQEVCFQYWPTSGVKQFGEFTVDLLGEEKLEGFILRTLSVLDTKVRSE